MMNLTKPILNLGQSFVISAVKVWHLVNFTPFRPIVGSLNIRSVLIAVGGNGVSVNQSWAKI